jgi:hypothetical protein
MAEAVSGTDTTRKYKAPEVDPVLARQMEQMTAAAKNRVRHLGIYVTEAARRTAATRVSTLDVYRDMNVDEYRGMMEEGVGLSAQTLDRAAQRSAITRDLSDINPPQGNHGEK